MLGEFLTITYVIAALAISTIDVNYGWAMAALYIPLALLVSTLFFDEGDRR